jgi:phage/plasmid primase-like uncharacterized protein
MNYNGNIIGDPIEQFHSAIQSAGITPPTSIKADGQLHRFSSNGKQGDAAGWYVLHVDGDIAVGCFGDWRTGLKQDWHANINRQLSIAEKAKFKEKIASIRHERESEEKRRRSEAQTKAAEIWSKADLASEQAYPYLIKKRIKASGIKIYNNSLVIPVYDENYLLQSLQFIDQNGEKRFLPGGRIAECYYTKGNIENASVLCIAEGVATSETIHEATGYPVVTAFNAGNLVSVARIMRKKFPDSIIILCADDDHKTLGNPGLSKAKEAAKAVRGVFITPHFNENRPDWASDFNDMMQLNGLVAVSERINGAIPSDLIPIDLPDSQPSVMPLEPEMLPPAIRDYIFDVADRQQSPPDFVAVATIIGLSGLLGRKILISPKQNDDWTVTPNQWGIIIGRPSAMKSPSMKEALKPLRQLEIKMAEQHVEAIQRYKEACLLAEITESVAKQNAKKAVQKGKIEEAKEALKTDEEAAPSPTRPRLIVNDATIEKLGELLNENPNGLILSRDELAGWLAKLTKEEYQADRAFYLECFDGNGHFVYDRIGRGTIDVKHCTLSVIGGIQPSKISTLVREAIKGTADDGLIQRFQFAVWPDDIGTWEWRDRAPNQTAKANYYKAFERIHNLTFHTIDGEPPCLKFCYEAQQLFIEWMEDLQVKAREEYTHPAIESHMLKMPQTIAGLALLFEIIDGGHEIVGWESTTRALMWADYLLSHAYRLYSVATDQCIHNAKLILKRKDKLPNPFSVRDIHRKNWAGLDSVDVIMEALECLIDYRHIRSKKILSTTQGGRPTSIYQWVANLNRGLEENPQKSGNAHQHQVTELT